MPTVTKITLDAGDYKAELEAVVKATRDARAKMEATAGGGASRPAPPPVQSPPPPQPAPNPPPVQPPPPQPAPNPQQPAPPNQQQRGDVRQISKAGAAVGALSNALGGANPQLAMMGQLFSVILSGIVGIVAAAAGLVAALAIGIWDNLTVSLTEAAAKTDSYAAAAERARQKEEAQQTALQKHMDKLRELSSAESTHKNALGETVAALDALERKYGDLGAEIDKTTGRITNFQEVNRRAREAGAKQMGGKVSNELGAMRAQANAQYVITRKEESGQNRWTARSEVKAMDAMPLEARLSIMRKRQHEATTQDAIAGYVKQIELTEKMIEKEKELRSIRNTKYKSQEDADAARLQKEGDVAAGKNTIDQMDRDAARKQADSELSRLTDPDKKTANREALITQEKAKQAEITAKIEQAEKDIASAEKYDEQLEAEQRRLAAVAELKKSQAEIASLENEITQIKHEQTEAARKLAEQSKFEVDYAKLIAAGEYDKAAALKQQHELKQQYLLLTEAEKQAILDNQKALQAIETGKRIAEGKDELEIQRALLAGDFDRANALKLQLEYKKQGKALGKEDQDALLGQQKKSQDLDTDKTISENQTELEIQRLILAGEYEKADALKRQLEYKRQGKTLDKDQEAALKKQQDARNALNLQQSMKDQAQGLVFSAMEKAGQGEEAARAKALYDAEKRKGAKLTDDEAANVEKLSKLTFDLSLDRAPQLGDTGIKTNALTSRGGFQGGAWVPPKDDINKSIFSSVKQAYETLSKIEGYMDKINQSIKDSAKVN